MKTIQITIAILLTLTAVAVFGQVAATRDNTFTPNPNLAYDAVELASNAKSKPGDFYNEPPTVRPPNVPANCMLVKVWQHRDTPFLIFLGYAYIPTEEVKHLHNQ